MSRRHRVGVCLLVLCSAAAQAQTEGFETLAERAEEAKAQGRNADAESAWRGALQQEEKSGTVTARTVIALNGLGSALRAQSRTDEAERAYLRARDACEKSGMAGNSAMALTLNNLGALYQAQARF